MEATPDKSCHSVLYPSFSPAVASIAGDPQLAFSIPQYSFNENYSDSNPMSKAWLEYQHSRGNYSPVTNWTGPNNSTWLGSSFQFGSPLNSFSNFQGRGNSDNSEKFEREETPALRKIEVTLEQKMQQESSKDILEKMKSMERKVSDLTYTNQFLLGRLSEIEKSGEKSEKNEIESLLHVDDKEKTVAYLIGENSKLKGENQMLQEKETNLLETKKHLEAELTSLKQEVEQLQQDLKILDSKMLKLQSANQNLEHELELSKINQRKREDKPTEPKANRQESMSTLLANTALTEDQFSLDEKLCNKLEDDMIAMDTKLQPHTGNKECNYSEQQLKELLARVDAITSENLEEDTEVLATDIVPRNGRFEKFAANVTQNSLKRNSNGSHNTQQVKSMEELNILRKNCCTTVGQSQKEIADEENLVADLSDNVGKKLGGRPYEKANKTSDPSVNEGSCSDSFLSLSSEQLCDYDLEMSDENTLVKTNPTQQKLENKKFQQILAEKDLITQCLLSMMDFISSNSGCGRESQGSNAGEETSSLCFLKQIEKQSQSIMRESTKLYSKVHQLNENKECLQNRTETTDVVNKSNSKVELSRQDNAQVTSEMNPVNQGEYDLRKVNEATLEMLESTFSENHQSTEELEAIKKLKETIYELQKELENKVKELFNEKKEFECQTKSSKYLSPKDVMDKKKNALLDIVQETNTLTRSNSEEWDAFKGASKSTETSLRNTIEELEVVLGKSKAHIATLVTVNNNLNVEKNAMLVTLEEIKAGLGKASGRVKELERDLEKARQGEKRLSITLKKFYDDFKVEQKDNEALRSKDKASQEENAQLKIELLTTRGVLEKEREAKRVLKGREREMQAALNEARESRELQVLELKILKDYKEKWQEQHLLHYCGLNQEEEQRLRKLGEMVESINSKVMKKVTLRFDQLQELWTLRNELLIMKGQNAALKTKISRIKKHSSLSKEETKRLSIEVQRLNSLVDNFQTNEMNSSIGSEQSLPRPDSKQKSNIIKKSLRRRLSGFSNTGSNRKIDSSSSKEFHSSLDKRMSQIEDELTLLRNELHGQTLSLDDGLEIQSNSQGSSNDSEESGISEASITKETNQRSVEIEPIASLIQEGLKIEIKIDSEIQELKTGVTDMLENAKEQLDASNEKMKKVTEELESKDRVLKYLQIKCKNSDAEKESFKKEIISLQDALQREVDAKIESIEKQRNLELVLNETLKAKADIECHVPSILENNAIDKNNARKVELKELCEVLHSIYDPINRKESELQQLQTDLKKKQEEIKLLRKNSENCASVELTDIREMITSHSLTDLQQECVLLKKENEIIKQGKDTLRNTDKGCQSKKTIGKENPAKLIKMSDQLRKKTFSLQAESENHKRRSKTSVEDNFKGNKFHLTDTQKASLENALRESEANVTFLMEQLKMLEDSKARSDHRNDTMDAKLQKFTNVSKNTTENQELASYVSKTMPENVKHENALNARLLRLNSDLNIAEQEKTHLESTLSFIKCANKSYEAEVHSLRVELEKEIASKCSYKNHEARLQESLSQYREELERLRDEVLRLYENLKNIGSENLELEKTILSLTAENAKLKARMCTSTSTDNLLGNEMIHESLKETSEMIHHFQEETKHSEEELIRRLKNEQKQREKAERELSSLKEVSEKIEEQHEKTKEKLQNDFEKVEENLNRTIKRLVEDEERNKNVSKKLVKSLEDKTKVEEETRTLELQRRESVKESKDTERLHDLKTNEAAGKSQNDKALRRRIILLEDERKTLNQKIINCENDRKEIEEQGNEEIGKLRAKITFLEQVLSVNEREKLRLREDNKNIENDTRRLSEQVSEEVENVRNESRAIEAALQDRIERLQSELKASEEQVVEENKNFKAASENCKRVTQEYENCKAALAELIMVAKEHENCKLAIKENEELLANCKSLSDNIALLKDELTKTEEAKAKYQRSTTSLKQAATALYIEVITLKAQLEILAVDNLKAVEKNNHLQSLYDEAVSASRGLKSEVENTLLIQNQEQHEKNIKADSDLFHICSATSITEVKVCVEDEQDTGK